jgi:glutathione S-transferase
LETKAQLMQWMFAALNTVEPPLLDLLLWNLFWKDRPGRDVRYPEVLEVCKTRLAELDKILDGKHYLLGETFSPADILMVTVLDFGKIEPSIFEAAPRVRDYLARCKARAGYKSAYAKHLAGPAAKAA